MAGEDKLDKIIGHLEDLHKKSDAINARLDVIETEHEKDRGEVAALRAADAEAKEKEEKEKADAAAKRRTDSGEDKHAFANAQMRADSAFNSWGKSAPHALHGESLRDFRVRLLTELKPHSKAYKDSDLGSIGDETAFSNIEGMIINDAIEASNQPDTTAGAALRKVTSRDDMGRITTKFYGDPLVCWAPFMGGATRFGRIVHKPNA
jgi:hypothetical protein